MKLGVKEFRDRLSECVRGDALVTITHHGRVVGHFVPNRPKPADTSNIAEWASDLEHRRDAWRAVTPNWREMMQSAGLDPEND